MAEPPRQLVLASASPFRRRMLEAAGLAVRVAPADVDEPAVRRSLAGAEAADVALALARAKAETISLRHPEAWVVGADQVLALDNEMLSKPRDIDEARRDLQRLRGRSHGLATAVALAQAGNIVWQHVETPWLTMRAFSDAFLERYLAGMGERACLTVGAYEVEGCGIQLFERIDGDMFTIIGLPLIPLLAELRARGVIAT